MSKLSEAGGDREIALQWVSGALLHTSHNSHISHTTYTYTIDSIAVSLFVDWLSLSNQKQIQSDDLMMRRADMST